MSCESPGEKFSLQCFPKILNMELHRTDVSRNTLWKSLFYSHTRFQRLPSSLRYFCSDTICAGLPTTKRMMLLSDIQCCLLNGLHCPSRYCLPHVQSRFHESKQWIHSRKCIATPLTDICGVMYQRSKYPVLDLALAPSRKVTGGQRLRMNEIQ